MERVKLYDIDVSLGGFSELIDESIEKEHAYSCFLNAHMIYEHNFNHHFDGVLSKADYIFPDGMPVVYSLRSILRIRQERIAGNDVISYLIGKAKTNSLKIFFIGGSDDLLDRIKKKTDNKGIIASFYSPPYLPIEKFDFEYQKNLINDFNPDIILVGLGCPKQEIWMSRMKDSVKAPMYGLGGAFLLYAEVDKRAPKWMRDLSLEWLYRMHLEPRRLFKRYLLTNTFFLFLLVRELIKKMFYSKRLAAS